jgi:hypothetical protein
LVSILEPFKEINKPSPLKVPFLSQGWYNTNDMSAMKKVKNKRVHPAVVMRYNDTSKTAVILLGTMRPEPQVHCFIPCYGVKRHDFQTTEILQPTPLETFLEWGGHFNFSHAIHVRVLQSHEYDQAFWNVSGLGLFKDDEGPLCTTLACDQMALLKTLHTSYWEGKRPTKDGLFQVVAADAPGSLSGVQGSSSGVQGSSSGVQGSSTGEPQDMDPDPVLGPSGLTVSQRMAIFLDKEDERATQVELLDEDEDLATLSGPSHFGIFQPLTAQRLNLYSGPLFHPKTTDEVEEDVGMV